jgi:hypothetical protein
MPEEPIVICRASPPGVALVPIEPDKDADVIGLVQCARTICQYAESRVVASLEDTKSATEDLSTLSLTMKAVRGKQIEYTKPYRTLLASIDDVFKPIIDSLDKATSITKNKILAYRAEVDRKHREAEEINRQAVELARRQAAANEGVITVDTTPVPVPAAAPAVVRTEVGSSGISKIWKFEVTDFKLLPDEYKIPDQVKIGKVVRAGVAVPGVRAWQEESLRVTPR